jgi:hypothetical protein
MDKVIAELGNEVPDYDRVKQKPGDVLVTMNKENQE